MIVGFCCWCWLLVVALVLIVGVAAPPRKRKVQHHKSGADEALSKLTHGAEEAMEAAAS